MRRFVRGAVAVLLTATAGCGGPSAQHPAPGASATAQGTPATQETGERTPITLIAPRVGDKYVYLTKQKRNRKVYVLRADAENGQYFGENSGRSSFVNPHITFYGESGKQLVADAPAGVVVERAKTVSMDGGVRAHTQDGIRLTSDTLQYDDATQMIHASGNVVMDSSQGNELRGNVLDWNLRTGAIDVTGAR